MTPWKNKQLRSINKNANHLCKHTWWQFAHTHTYMHTHTYLRYIINISPAKSSCKRDTPVIMNNRINNNIYNGSLTSEMPCLISFVKFKKNNINNTFKNTILDQMFIFSVLPLFMGTASSKFPFNFNWFELYDFPFLTEVQYSKRLSKNNKNKYVSKINILCFSQEKKNEYRREISQ